MKKIHVIFSLLMMVFAIGSCKKDDSSTSYKYSVRLTDAPGPYSSVFVDIQGVEITGSNGKAVALNVNAGVYDLIKFSSGVDTLLATGSIDVAKVQQIRLILGPNNSVVVNNVSYPLSTPSAEQSGLKLQVHQELQAGVDYVVLLDFDANQSIVETGSGTYKLKPVIRTIETAISGAIKGKISPTGVLSVVSATAGVTYSTNVSTTGDFIISGLPAGTYTVNILPAAPYKAVTINNVVVNVGSTTNVGLVSL